MPAPVSAEWNYLRLRLTLLGRLLRELGWWRVAALLALLVPALLQVVGVLGSSGPGRWLLPGLVAAGLAGAHRRRADLGFLQQSSPRSQRWLALEYGLLSLPVALGLLALRAYGPALMLPGLAAGVAWLPPARAGQAPRRWRSPVRAEAFEWVSGLRTAGAGWGWLALLALAWWPGLTLVGPPLALLAWLLVAVGCYGTPEPVAMLVLALRQPGQFLRRRLVLALGYGALTAGPLAAGLGSWRPALAGLLAWLVLLALAVLAKYAFYPTAAQLRLTQGLVLAVALLGLTQPIYPPLMVVIVGLLIWQSRRRLGQYLPPLSDVASA